MPIFTAQCPYCLKENMSFRTNATVRLSNGEPKHIFLSFCPNCSKPVGAFGDYVYRPHPGRSPIPIDFNAQANSHIMLVDLGVTDIDIWPKAQKVAAPDHLPDGITRIFLQGEDNRSRGHLDAAGMCYRRTLDLAIQQKRGQSSGNLSKDITKFASEHGVPTQVIEWATLIRVIGNDANHDPSEPTNGEIEDLAMFTRVFLEYVFTLPEQVLRRITLRQTP